MKIGKKILKGLFIGALTSITANLLTFHNIEILNVLVSIPVGAIIYILFHLEN
jgi:hypothetical protein